MHDAAHEQEATTSVTSRSDDPNAEIEHPVFECTLCGTHAPYDYYGDKPPFAKPIRCVVMKDL